MKANVGGADKIARFIIAALAIVASFFTTGILVYVLWAVAVIMVLTALVSFCPIYQLFGIKTCRG